MEIEIFRDNDDFEDIEEWNDRMQKFFDKIEEEVKKLKKVKNGVKVDVNLNIDYDPSGEVVGLLAKLS